MPDHGTRYSYIRGCRCDPCRQANCAHFRDLRLRHRPAGMPAVFRPDDTRIEQLAALGADMPAFERALAEVFAGRYTVNGDCWEAEGWRDPKGYVRSTIGGGDRTVRVHRFFLSVRLGRPVRGMALHRCNNPPCFRPSHIYEGDGKANAADREASGNTIFGERAGWAKLTPEQVVALRLDRDAGMTYPQLGEKYGITKQSARKVAIREAWRSVA